jgi:hypothetical protein
MAHASRNYEPLVPRTAILKGAIAMSAEMHRNDDSWSARPQVGRFYGDFLCMASIREKNIFSVGFRPAPDLALKSKVKRWLAGPPTVSKRLKPLANFCGR